MTLSLLHKKYPLYFLSPTASPIHNHRDPLPGAEGSHVLQLFVCDPHRNQQLLGVTGAQSAKRTDGITKLDLRHVMTRSRDGFVSQESSPHRTRGCARQGLSLDWYFGSPAPALSLVVAVDVGDSPDVLQIKAHPRELSLLATSYVLSCNTAPTPVSIQQNHGQGWRRVRTKRQEISQRKQPGLTWLT